MDANSPQAALDKLLEEIAPLTEEYNRATETLKRSYEKAHVARRDFLESGIEYTKIVPEDAKPDEKLMKKYERYKTLLEERMGVSKKLLGAISGVLSSLDQQLLVLDSQYDPKFGIQTQNPRIFKTNKSAGSRAGTEDPEKNRYCICNRPAHGDMIACDAYHMDSPWFHMECVGCSGTPRGNWLCPKCKPSE